MNCCLRNWIVYLIQNFRSDEYWDENLINFFYKFYTKTYLGALPEIAAQRQFQLVPTSYAFAHDMFWYKNNKNYLWVLLFMEPMLVELVKGETVHIIGLSANMNKKMVSA